MTKKFCRNCKHLETDGMFGIFCGVVGGNNINHDCPKYEEEPEERFVPIFDGSDKRVVGAKDNGKIISLMDMFVLLNEFHEKNEELKHEYNYLQNRLDNCFNIFNENQELKEELRKFKEWEKTICYNEEGVERMTEKRFQNQGKDILQYGEWWCSAGGEHCADVIATAINELLEENEQLKFKLEEVRSDEKQLGISFMEFKMKLIEKLQIHYDYASEQRQKNLDNLLIAKAYDIIRYDVRKLAEEMGVDLE